LKGILAGSVSTIALLAVTTPSIAADQGVETVVVTGIRASNQRAIDIKRNATNMVDAVSAEDIGKLPDKNVADALQRVPGVQTYSTAAGEGGFDENDRVAIRGTNPSLTQTMIDGHSVATGDWFILDQFSTVGRSVSYTLLPSEIVKNVSVYKSQSADMVEGGVAGVVDIQTHRPLDFDQPLTLLGSAQGVYSDLPGKIQPQVNALVSWHNDSGTFGILAQGFYEKRSVRRDGQEFLGYANVAATDASAFNAITNPTGIPVGTLYPSLIGSALFEQTRQREGGDLAIEWQPMKGLDLTASAFYSHLDADNFNENYLAWVVHEIQNNSPSAFTVTNNTLTHVVFPLVSPPAAGGVPVDGVVTDNIVRPGAGSDTYFVDLDGNYQINEDWKVHGKLGYTRGTGFTPTQPAFEVNAPTGLVYNMNSGGAAVQFPDINPANAADLANDWSWSDKVTSVDKEFYAQADAEDELDWGVIKSIKFGARVADHSRVVDTFDHGGCALCGTSFAAAATGNYPPGYGDGLGITGLLTGVAKGDPNKISALIDPLFVPTATGPAGQVHYWYYWPGSFKVYEYDTAGYAMANIGGDKWNGNVGVRLVYTHEDSWVYVPDGPFTTPAQTACVNTGAMVSAYGCWNIDKVKHDYWDVLPSVNLNFDLTDEQKLRFSANEVMARPDYSALAGSVSLTDLIFTGSGGNPDLKPIKAATFQGSWEWYYGPQSLLSVSLFYMDLSTTVTFGTHQGLFPDASLPGNPLRLYTITSPINGSGRDQGIELAWQQPVWDGFGFLANYTYADGSENSGGPLLGDAKNTFNVTGYYENDWLSARLAYTYRTKVLIGLDRSTALTQDGTGNLDASVSWTIDDNIALTFDALNLTDETLHYFGNNPGQPRAFYDNGRQFFFGVRLKN
jgi:iron complex outermembrane receptor protein